MPLLTSRQILPSDEHWQPHHLSHNRRSDCEHSNYSRHLAHNYHNTVPTRQAQCWQDNYVCKDDCCRINTSRTEEPSKLKDFHAVLVSGNTDPFYNRNIGSSADPDLQRGYVYEHRGDFDHDNGRGNNYCKPTAPTTALHRTDTATPQPIDSITITPTSTVTVPSTTTVIATATLPALDCSGTTPTSFNIQIDPGSSFRPSDYVYDIDNDGGFVYYTSDANAAARFSIDCNGLLYDNGNIGYTQLSGSNGVVVVFGASLPPSGHAVQCYIQGQLLRCTDVQGRSYFDVSGSGDYASVQLDQSASNVPAGFALIVINETN